MPFLAGENAVFQGGFPPGEKRRINMNIFALVNVQMALGQTAGCPRINRAKRFMCSPRNTGNISFSLWLTGGLSQGCPDFQKVYVFKVYVPFPCPRIFRMFVRILPRILLLSFSFRASFHGKRGPEKIHRKSPPFFNANSLPSLQIQSENDPKKPFWRAGKLGFVTL